MLTDRVCILLKVDQAALKRALQNRQLVVRGSSTDVPLKINQARSNRCGGAGCAGN